MNAAAWLALSALCFGLGTGVAHASGPAPKTETETQQNADAAPLDLNQATLAQLEELPGIGTKRAQAILDFRAAHHGFQSVSQLLQIKGIGRSMLRKLRPLVTIGGSLKEGSAEPFAVR